MALMKPSRWFDHTLALLYCLKMEDTMFYKWNQFFIYNLCQFK
jgi:hypothetical protein